MINTELILTLLYAYFLRWIVKSAAMHYRVLDHHMFVVWLSCENRLQYLSKVRFS